MNLKKMKNKIEQKNDINIISDIAEWYPDILPLMKNWSDEWYSLDTDSATTAYDIIKEICTACRKEAVKWVQKLAMTEIEFERLRTRTPTLTLIPVGDYNDLNRITSKLAERCLTKVILNLDNGVSITINPSKEEEKQDGNE